MSDIHENSVDHDAEPPRIKLMAFIQRALLGESTSDYLIDWPNWRWLLLPLGAAIGYGCALLAPVGDHGLRPLSYLTKDAQIRDGASGESQVIGSMARGDSLVGLKPGKDGWRKFRGRQAFVEAASISHLKRPDLDTTFAGIWTARVSGDAPSDVDGRIKVVLPKGDYPVVGRVRDGPMKGRLEVVLGAGIAYVEAANLSKKKAEVIDRPPPPPPPPRPVPPATEKPQPAPEAQSPAPAEPAKAPSPDPALQPEAEDRTPTPKSGDYLRGKVPGRLAIEDSSLRPGIVTLKLNCRVKFRKAEWEKFGDGVANCRDTSNSRVWALHSEKISAFVFEEYRLARGPYGRNQTIPVEVQVEIMPRSKEAGSR